MNNRGISLISLIITIVSIIIIATISIYNGHKTPEMANFTGFLNDIDMVRVDLGVLRTQNFEKYGDINYGFEEVYVENAPESFISISKNEVKGYLIHTDVLKDSIKYGNGTISSNTVNFDLDDVLVYDKNGTVYYARGFLNDGQLFYNATVFKTLY